MSQVSWSYKAFDQLTPFELYRILRLRNKVFVVEQNCVYDDTDGKDLSCFHLCGYLNDELVAYARIVPPGVSYAEPCLGRIATALAVRRKGIGRELMRKGIDIVKELYGNTGIRISAQAYLIDFYSSFDFNSIGEPYLEDDIPHIEMLLPFISNT
jgi:ElaA protein